MTLFADVTARRRLASAPPYDLITVARRVSEPDDRWESGFTWEPEACGGGSDEGVAPFGFDPCRPDAVVESAVKLAQPTTAFREWRPVGVVTEDRCSALDGARTRDAEARARRRLEKITPHALAWELFSGDAAREFGWPNLYLSQEENATVVPGSFDLAAGFTCLDWSLSEGNGGEQAMIHVPPYVLGRLQDARLVRWSQNIYASDPPQAGWLSPMGHVVVSSGMYSGGGPSPADAEAPAPPAAGDVWIYGTDIVDVRVGGIEIRRSVDYAAGLAGREVAANRGDEGENTIVVRAERVVAASWDGCRHLAMQIDDPFCVPEAS